MPNIGKQFENAIKDSMPEYALVCRLPDSAQSFGHSAKLRFSLKNPFDFIIWDSPRKVLYALELKTVAGKSISFERSKDEHGEIHFHQIQGLNEWNRYSGTCCGFIIEFRQIETTIFLHIEQFNVVSKTLSKKSFTIKDLDEVGAEYVIISQHKKRTKFTYGVAEFLER